MILEPMQTSMNSNHIGGGVSHWMSHNHSNISKVIAKFVKLSMTATMKGKKARNCLSDSKAKQKQTNLNKLISQEITRHIIDQQNLESEKTEPQLVDTK